MTLLAHRLSLVPLLALLALAAGCSKAKESLILVELRLAEGNASNLASVTLTATDTSPKTFPLAQLDVDTPETFGLYVGGDVTGNVTVTAVATLVSGCAGFHGEGSKSIATAGETVMVKITMQPDTACPSDGGAAGSGGGGAGSGGSGGGPGGGPGGAAGSGQGGSVPGQVPTLNNCRDFDHVGPNCPTSTSVRAVAISPDGQTVATAGDSFNNKIKIWRFDGRTLTPANKELTGHTDGLAFSPDGTKLAVVDRTVVRLWNTSNWTAGPVLQGAGTNDDMVGVGFTPNGQRVVSADHAGFSGGNLYVHAISGNGLPAITQHVAEEPSSVSVSPVPSPDGSVAVAVGTWYGTAHGFALGAAAFTGPTVIATNATEDAVWVSRFSPDGSLFVTGDRKTRFWDYPALTAITPDVAIDYTKDLAFSPDGKYVASGGSDGRLSLLAISNHAETARHSFPDDVESFVFSPSGTAIIVGLYDCGKVFVCSD